MPQGQMQQAVQDLLSLGHQLTADLSEETIELAGKSAELLQRPVSAHDAVALISLLPASGDSCYGLNWTILHAIESCPDWPIWSLLKAENHEWIDRLRVGLKNAGIVESS